MLFEKKSFNAPDSGGDYDTAPTDLAPNAWINAENVRILTTDAGEVGNLESIGSTELLPNPYIPSGTNIEIGSIPDEVKGRLVSFNWNSNGDHGIYAYYFDLKSWFIVLLDSQVTDGLNFDKNQIIHSARIVNNCAYWVNYLQNRPRRINIEAGIKMNHPSFVTSFAPYTNPLSQAVISWARRPEALPPTIKKDFDASVVTNNIATFAGTFCYYYQFRDFETSVLGFQSLLANYNNATDVLNYISVTMPLLEHIDQDVIRIFLVARFLDTAEYVIVNTWDVSNPDDLVAITNHNNGTAALTFNFYNNSTGQTLDSAFSVKPFDSIPIFGKTMDVAKNRAFIGHDVLGYTSPSQTSLAFTLLDPETSSVTGRWFLFRFQNVSAGITTIKTVYLLDIVTLPPTYPLGYYVENSPSPHPPFPASINWSDIQFAGGGLFNVMSFYFPVGTNSILQFVNQNASSTIAGAPVGPTTVSTNIFKTDSSYQLAVTFYDEFQQKCGAVTNKSLVAIMPDRSYASVGNVIGISWTLSNTNAAAEIMKGAHYYSIDITLCLRTRFFQQARASAQVAGDAAIGYVTKASDGTYNFLNTTYATNQLGISVDISCLNGFGQGYSFQQGDEIKLYLSNTSTVYTLSVIDQQAQYVICQLAVLGTLDVTVGVLFEIYTPYKRATTEPYFEVAQVFPIVDPDTLSPTYSVTSGTITGDVTVLQRMIGATSYYVESMSPNDKLYKNWNTNAGRPNFIDKIGQQSLTNDISFSNTFILGSQTNGLSTFDALDTKSIFAECGPISKLQLTSKVEGDVGNIMLGICEDETCSLYLSETQMLSSDANQFLAQATGVIGTINVLRGSFGTSTPESVYEFRGNVFWWNEKNGKIIQYSSNGLFPISNYKATRFWKLFSEQFLSMTQAEIEALGSRPFVFTCVDPHNWELLVTVPRVLEQPPKGYLPDYPFQYIDVMQSIRSGGPFDGYIEYTYTVPLNPTPFYGSTTQQAQLVVQGRNGKIVSLNAPPNNQGYPAQSAGQIIAAGVAFALVGIANDPADFAIDASGFSILLLIKQDWDWGTGDNDFGPPVSVNIIINPIRDASGDPIVRAISYPFDIYDGQAKTIVYKLSAQPNFWQGSYNHRPEGMISMRNMVFGFKNGQCYQYNSITDYTISIFGETYKARLMSVGNQSKNKPKVYNNISVEGNYRPSLTYFRVEPGFVEFERYDLPEQASDLVDYDYEIKEGQQYCQLFRNKLQPTATGMDVKGILTGQKIRALTLFVLVEFTPTKAPVELRNFTMGYQISAGHTT